MKSLYNEENEDYTDDALALDGAIMDAVRPIMKKYKEMGFKARDIGKIAQDAVILVAIMELMESRLK